MTVTGGDDEEAEMFDRIQYAILASEDRLATPRREPIKAKPRPGPRVHRLPVMGRDRRLGL